MKKYIPLLFAILLMNWGCKPDLKGELGESSDKVAAMDGDWTLTAFSQRDENNPIKEVRDLSEFYVIPGETPTQIAFNSSDRTYSVMPGAGKNYFGSGGTWRFDDDFAPSVVILETLTDTLSLALGSMPRPFESTLSFELPRYCVSATGSRTATVTYIIDITRNN
jgi:Domain of unknown function (DUF5004)